MNPHFQTETVKNLQGSHDELRFAVDKQLAELSAWSQRVEVAYYLSRHDKVLVKNEHEDLKDDLVDLQRLILKLQKDILSLGADFTDEKVLVAVNLRKEIYARFRTSLSLYASLVTTLNWQSPAIKSSFGSRIGVEKAAVIADWNDYKRDRSEDTFYYERYLAENVFNASCYANDTVLNICNSGMGAFTTILYYLLATGNGGGKILISNQNYVENKIVLKTFLGERAHFFEPTTTTETLAAIHAHKPSVVFLEQIGNTKVLRLLDIKEIIDDLITSHKEDLYLVIDVTCSVGFEPFPPSTVLPKNIKVLLHGSLLKAPQLGLERVNMGFVQAINLGEDSDKILDNRTLSGTNVQDFAVNQLPFTTNALLRRRMARISQNAKTLAVFLSQIDPEKSLIESVIYPGLESHPDHEYAEKTGFQGFFFNVRLVDKFNTDRYFELLTSHIIKHAHEEQIDVIHGASFGFNHTSIYYSVGWDEPKNHYLRISPGIETPVELEKVKRVFENAVVSCAQEIGIITK